MPNHQNNFSTNLTSSTSAGATTSPINSIPSVAAPFYIAFDATNSNSHYEVVQVTSKTATDILHAATSYDHTTAETVSLIVPAEEMDALSTGWQAAPGTWTYSSADSPTFVMTTSIDMSSFIGVGTRIKLTQTTAKYFIVTAISGTTVTLYGGTDYTLANAAITSPYFSIMKCPIGFPVDPTKWTVTTTDVTGRSQSTPTQNTWYNLGSISITVPIGAWRTSYQVTASVDDTTTTLLSTMKTTLSTANNSESDVDFTCWSEFFVNSSVSGTLTQTFFREKILVLASKTPYYLNTMTATASMATIANDNDASKLIIRAVCAYL